MWRDRPQPRLGVDTSQRARESRRAGCSKQAHTSLGGISHVPITRPEPRGSREKYGLFPLVSTPRFTAPHKSLRLVKIDSVLTVSVCTQTNSPAGGTRRQLDLRPHLPAHGLPKRTSPAAAPARPDTPLPAGKARTGPGRDQARKPTFTDAYPVPASQATEKSKTPPLPGGVLGPASKHERIPSMCVQ